MKVEKIITASSVSVIQAARLPYVCHWCSHSVYATRTPPHTEDAADEVLWIRSITTPTGWYADLMCSRSTSAGFHVRRVN
jgi:hypothetical protein